ncbi:MAG: STAS domain-containing protein [Desulfobacterales bacterium]|nr:STAS domain-containing protein [Desulfobacterales bacterium]
MASMEQQIKIGLQTVGDVTLFDIKGDVTALAEPFFYDAYQKAKGKDSSKILFIFKTDCYINSGGLALLIQILAECKMNNQKTGITGLSGHFKKIFNMVDITKFAKIYDTLEEALEAMSGLS